MFISLCSSRRTSNVKEPNVLYFHIANELKVLLDICNPLVKTYRMVRDRCHVLNEENVKLRLIGTRQTDGRTHNLPIVSEVAAIVFGDFDGSFDNRDIIVEMKNGVLKRINEQHPSYLPHQYPLLFPYAEDGYRVGIAHRGITDTKSCSRSTLTMREFFSYLIQQRVSQFSLLLNARKLFQQFLVDGYTMIEAERLYYIRNQQKKFRVSSATKLSKAFDDGNSDASQIGNGFTLLSSFTGGSRYMMQNYLDAMAICKRFGYPDLFLTFTCNPKWPEINRFMTKFDLKPEDRPDIMSRVFKIKFDLLIKHLKDKKLFGDIQASMFTYLILIVLLLLYIYINKNIYNV